MEVSASFTEEMYDAIPIVHKLWYDHSGGKTNKYLILSMSLLRALRESNSDPSCNHPLPYRHTTTQSRARSRSRFQRRFFHGRSLDCHRVLAVTVSLFPGGEGREFRFLVPCRATSSSCPENHRSITGYAIRTSCCCAVAARA